MTRVRAALASGNEHKLRELRALLPEWELEPLATADAPEETGASFYQNARAKALFGRSTAEPGVWTLGEDSGIEVEALGGGPGIRSARYAGPNASDEENVAKLLEELAGKSQGERRARYVSELVCIAPDHTEFRGTGRLEGRIVDAPRGSGGFGYDPIFAPAGEDRTVAELGNKWKREHSHRAVAARALVQAVGVAAEAL
jgi:XTP/dITP diphosphohydrolase